MASDKLWALYVGTYPPRECGIATFTQDLTTAMDKKFNPTFKSKILAINDESSSIYNYKPSVKLQVDETDVEAYINIAKRINHSKTIQVVNIQHEFGIFGGDYGEFLIPFLETLKKPVVTTFHSVLPNPDLRRKKIVQAIAKRSSAIIVMAQKAVDILSDQYEISRSKLNVVPHGVPTVSFKSTEQFKKSLGFENKIILSTFGLINSGKGIEHVIQALPSVVEKYPNLLYIVIGETHPKVRKEEGEHYRNKLIKLVTTLKLTNNVRFYNKYLSLQELTKFLCATDIYIAPALDLNQICSGTISYAMGCGKSIISTPSLYAQEVLSDDRGILVNFADTNAMSNSIRMLLDNKELKKEIENKAYEYSRSMTWPNVAEGYFKVFKKIIKIKESVGLHKFPKIKLNHLSTLTDNVGILQHAKYSVTDRSTGYTLDDNTRALIVATKHYDKFKDQFSLNLVNAYLSFIRYVQMPNGKFHNFISYDRKFLDKEGSEDSFGRAIWSLGHTVNSNLLENIKPTAKFIFDNSVENIYKLKHLRPKAFSIVGLYYYYKIYKHQDIIDKIKYLADSLLKEYEKNSTNDWQWFEKEITYSNGKLPEALFFAYDIIKDEKYLEIAEKTLNFLSSLIIFNDRIELIGHNGWYNHGGQRAFFDQQPVDASSMVQVYLTAFITTNKREYYDKAVLAFNWFLGKNSLSQTVYDESTGGCYDGLLPNCINLNQGAESTISYLIARLYLEENKQPKT